MSFNNRKKPSSIYPQVNQSNPSRNPSSSSSSNYPTIEMNELAENLFQDESPKGSRTASSESSEEVLIRIPGAIVHLIDNQQSIELANGEFSVIQLKQGGNVVAAFARVGDQIQWPLAKDEAAVKLDNCHYFFNLRVPSESGEINSDAILNYGLTIATKGQEGMLKKLDSVLDKFSAFREEKAAAKVEQQWWGSAAKKEDAAVYWTILAPNVEDYSGSIARLIAAGSGQVVRGILWSGDVTADRLKWGHEFLKKRIGKSSSSEISPNTMKRMKRVKKLTKMSEKVAKGILSGVVNVSGFFTTLVANSKVGQKFFSLLPCEIVLASLDGFNKVFDAIEAAGKNVMSTSKVITTELVTQKYGEDAGQVTGNGLGAAGHAFGTAWTVFKIRKALSPKGAMKPTALAKTAATAMAAKPNSKVPFGSTD